MQNPAKVALRKQIKDLIGKTNAESRKHQSDVIARKVFDLAVFKNARRVSIYLSTDFEVDTIEIIRKMFDEKKEVFVPTYAGKEMKMVKLFDFDDYKKLPLTKWNIKQPNADELHRENPMSTAPLDLMLIPGVGFTRKGGRMGHGMGYYDKYLQKYFARYPDSLSVNKTHLIALAFREQIVADNELPLEPTDYPLDSVVTSD